MREPTLLMLKGHPGCGKSTLAEELSKQLSWTLVDKDDARDCLSAMPQAPAATLNALSYTIMFRMAATQLRCGNSVIVDCPLARIELWDEARRLADQYKADIVLVEIAQPEDAVWRARMEGRATANAQTTASHKPDWSQLQALIDGYTNCFLWPSATAIRHYIQLDKPGAQSSVEARAGAVFAYLQQHGMVVGASAPSEHTSVTSE